MPRRQSSSTRSRCLQRGNSRQQKASCQWCNRAPRGRAIHTSSMLLILLLHLLPGIDSFFTPHFNRYLSHVYTPAGQMLMERGDFGSGGSFGGKHNSSHEVAKQPVVIVHGVTNTAKTFEFVRQHLFQNGYSDSEVYATTYGDGEHKFVLFYKLQCQYVKQVRALMISVQNYTESQKIDVLAYSMGSVIARKAILGGTCDEEDIGPPITNLIDAYVGVAGANYGSSLCFVPWFICSKNNGLHCKSRFLKEINSVGYRYEGLYSFAIYSEDDNKVGMDCCGKTCSSIPFSKEEFRFQGYDHDGVMVATLNLQLSLIQNHTRG